MHEVVLWVFAVPAASMWCACIVAMAIERQRPIQRRVAK